MRRMAHDPKEFQQCLWTEILGAPDLLGWQYCSKAQVIGDWGGCPTISVQIAHFTFIYSPFFLFLWLFFYISMSVFLCECMKLFFGNKCDVKPLK